MPIPNQYIGLHTTPPLHGLVVGLKMVHWHSRMRGSVPRRNLGFDMCQNTIVRRLTVHEPFPARLFDHRQNESLEERWEASPSPTRLGSWWIHTKKFKTTSRRTQWQLYSMLISMFQLSKVSINPACHASWYLLMVKLHKFYLIKDTSPVAAADLFCPHCLFVPCTVRFRTKRKDEMARTTPRGAKKRQ